MFDSICDMHENTSFTVRIVGRIPSHNGGELEKSDIYMAFSSFLAC